jgi:hypothetical protein
MIYTIACYPVHLNAQVANGQVRDYSTLPGPEPQRVLFHSLSTEGRDGRLMNPVNELPEAVTQRFFDHRKF